MSRIVAVADLHGNLPLDLPGGDVLVIAGDVCPILDHGRGRQQRWLEASFYPWLERLPHPEVLWIAGNHDFACEQPDFVPAGRGRYLRDEGVEIGGLSFYGTPWVPNLPQWAFHASDEELHVRAGRIPPVDVLISHGPPRGYGDRLTSGELIGSEALIERIRRVPPRLCAFGHIHEAHGCWQRGPTTLANVAYVTELYEVRPNAPQLFELEA